MAASVGGLVVCCSVLFWVLLSPTTFQVTAAPFSKNAARIQQESHADASSASRNLDRDTVSQRRKKRYKNYPVAENPGGYDKNWDNRQFPGRNDYQNKVGPRGQYDPSGYRGDNSYREYADGRDPRYEEFKQSQLWKQRGPNYYNRRIEVPEKKVQPKKRIDTGSNTLYQPKRIGVPTHVAGFWGDSPDSDSPTLKEKSILQTLAKHERSGFHRMKPSSIKKKVSTQFDLTEKAGSNVPTNGRQDDGYPKELERYSPEYGRQNSRDQNNYQDVPYQVPQSKYRPPNELPVSYDHPNIGNMLGQHKPGVEKGAPVDGMLLNLHEAPGLVPVPNKHEPETADQTASAVQEPAQEPLSAESAQQPTSNDTALNTAWTSKTEFEIPMPPRSKSWTDMHPEEIEGPSTTAAPTAAPPTTRVAIPMPPKSKEWLEEQRLREEMQHLEEERVQIERLEEVSHRLGANNTSGGNSSRYLTDQEQAGEGQPGVDRQGVPDDTGGAEEDRVYLTREDYERLQHQAQLEQQRESMLEEQRQQESRLPAQYHVEEQDQSTNQVQEDTRDEVVNNTIDGPDSVKRDPTPEDIRQLRQAELERERQSMLEELLQEEGSEISSESQQSNETQTVNPLEEGSQEVTSNKTGSEQESLKQEELVQTRQNELEKEREQMLEELVTEENAHSENDQSETEIEQKKDEGLQAMADAWAKMNSPQRRRKRSVLGQYSNHLVNTYGKSASSGTGGEARGVAPNNDVLVNGQKIAMPAKRGNSFLKDTGKYQSFPVHEVKTDRLGVPKSVAGFWEDTKKDDDIAANKEPSSSSSHMKVTLNKANLPQHRASLAEKVRKLSDQKFYKTKGIHRLTKVSQYKKTPFEDDSRAAGRLSPFKDNAKPETETLPVHQKYPVPAAKSSRPVKANSETSVEVAPEKIASYEPETKTLPRYQKNPVPAVKSSLPIKANYETNEQVAPEKIVSFESGVDDVPVPVRRQKVIIHNAVPHPSQRRQEYTSEQILADKERVLQNTLSQKVALAKTHAVHNYQTDHTFVQEYPLVKVPEKLANESSSSSNETDISYQFFNPDFYNNIMARYKSKDALWAALCLTIVLFVLFFAVWYSKMWRKKGGDWDTRGKYQPEATSIPIKELIRQKLGRIPRLKVKLKRKRKGPIGHRYLQLKRKQSTGATSSEEEVMYKRL